MMRFLRETSSRFQLTFGFSKKQDCFNCLTITDQKRLTLLVHWVMSNVSTNSILRQE
jgi:hypothetical protein